MDFVTAVKSGYQNYVNFQGRASRPAYWWWVLFQVIVSVIIGVIFGRSHMMVDQTTMAWHYQGGTISNLWSLANLLPSLGLAIRRLHDIGRSGWWVLICLIPVVGWIILIVWYCQKSDAGPNAYGVAPDMAATA